MKKKILINVSGIIFQIEEDGYDKLSEYLETAKRSAASYNAPSVIMDEIENRIAEIFLNQLKEGGQIVTLGDVEDLMTMNGRFNVFRNIRNTHCIYLF